MGLRPVDWLILFLIIIAVLIISRRKPPAPQAAGSRGRKVTQADSRAVQILEDAGYSLVQVQPALTVNMEIHGKGHRFEMDCDYLVARDGRRYLVRLRSDNKRIRLNAKVWRNALLRDVLAFATDGILVLDEEKGTVTEVRFRL